MVEHQHCWLKEALTARGGDWTKALPWVLLGLRNTPRDNNNISATQQLYRMPLVMLGPFVDRPEASSHYLQLELSQIKDFQHPCPPPSSPPSACTRIPMMTHCYVRVDAVKPPLLPKYVGPFPVLRQTRNNVVIQRSPNQTDSISLERVKPYVGSRPPSAPLLPLQGQPLHSP